MPDYQRITDEIHDVLAAGNDFSTDAVAAVHREYCDTVREVNARLRTCGDLLARGQRSEAIRQCNAEPNLLDAVAILDFPDRPLWSDLAAKLRLPRAPELLIDIAGDLNEAYTAEQPLEMILRSHRLLALARAPLTFRIQNLRAIRAADPGNAIWEQDLRAYEKARLNEVASELKTAAQAQDLGRLANLEQEMRTSGWIEPLPQDLVRRVIQTHVEVRQRAARRELVTLAEQLNRAFSSLDVSAGRQLRARWNAAAAIGLSRNDDELLEIAAPALEWLRHEDEQESAARDQETALAALEDALDDSVGYDELERAYHAARRLDAQVPATLERRVAERFRYLQEASTRRHRFTLTAALLVVLFTAGAIGVGVFQHLRAKRVEQHAAQLASLLAEGKVVQAQEYAESLERSDPDACSAPAVQQRLANVRAAVAEEEGRRARLLSSLNSVRSRLATNATWESVAAGRRELEEARELAKSDEELSRIKTVELSLFEQHRQLQKAVDDQFLADLALLQSEFAQADERDLDSIAELITKARQLQKQPHVTPELLGPLEPLVARLNTYRQKELDAQREAQQLDGITIAVGNVDLFVQRLEEYSAKYPATTRAGSFQGVVRNEIPLWREFLEWNEFVEPWIGRELTAIRPEDAEQIVKRIKEFRDSRPRLPIPPELEKISAILSAIAQRVDGSGGRVHLSLVEMLNTPTISDLFMLSTSKGDRYYFRREPLAAPSILIVSYITGFGLDESGKVNVPVADVTNRRQGERFDWTAPQKQFSRTALEKLNRLTDANWESTFNEIVLSLGSEQGMEPVLRLQLLQRFLEIACQSSYCCEHAFKGPLEVVRNAGIDPGANWLDPNDRGGQGAREQAQRILVQLGDLKSAVTEVERVLAEAMRASWGRCVWIGWLRRDGQGRWTCAAHASRSEKQSGDLYVLDHYAASTRAQFRKVGQIRSGKAELAPSDDGLVEGRAVFLGTKSE